VDGMKFDVVVGNPPYKRNLHLDFLKISHVLLTDNGVGIIIHPGSWVLNEVPGLDKIKDAREWANKYVTEFEFRPSVDCFDVDLGVPVVITKFQGLENAGKINVLDKAATDTEYEVASIEAITKHGNNSIYQGLKKKVLSHISTSNSLRNYLNTKGNYYITLPTLIGNGDGGNFKTNAPFFSFTYKKNAYVRTELELKHTRYFGFQTKEEAENFLTYIKSYFARFCLSIAKFDRNLNPITLSSTPWMDFSKKWTDVELFEHFQLTKEEIEFIYKNIPSFYEDVPKINDPK
jgi:site-specific DNA-methyltransferase (adenine-specific)